MEEQTEVIETEVVIDCPHSDYSSDLLEIQTQVLDLQDSIDILNDTIQGGNAVNLLILTLLFCCCIYKLIRFVF